MEQPRRRFTENRADYLKTRIITGVADDLAIIEKELAKHLEPRFSLVKDVAGHILFSGGKRLRPLLMTLCSRLCGYKAEDQHAIAVSFEYLHAATLLHDDFIDQGTLRRGEPAAYTKYGNEIAVLTGDFLLARALALSAQTGDLEVVRTIVNITEQMSQGEIEQLNKKGNIDITEPEYLEIIYAKTAILFQGACRVGGLIAGANEDETNALADYGRHLGMAFQMTDDLLDYTASSKGWGKTPGTDLKEGKLTLPVIAALSCANKKEREEMITIIGDPDFTSEDFNHLVTLLTRLRGIDHTTEMAVKHVHRAKERLNRFPTTNFKKILNDIADYALERKS